MQDKPARPPALPACSISLISRAVSVSLYFLFAVAASPSGFALCSICRRPLLLYSTALLLHSPPCCCPWPCVADGACITLPSSSPPCLGRHLYWLLLIAGHVIIYTITRKVL